MKYATARRVLPVWLRRYVYSFETMIEAAVEALAHVLPEGAQVLDAGAGEGQYAEHFQRHRYTGVDLGVGDSAWNYSRLDALARMANHIAAQFPQMSDGEAADQVAAHIKSFWEADMRADLLDLAGREPGKLEARARLAVQRLGGERVAAD